MRGIRLQRTRAPDPAIRHSAESVSRMAATIWVASSVARRRALARSGMVVPASGAGAQLVTSNEELCARIGT